LSPAREPTAHTEIQWSLLKLGNNMGLDVWVARNDRSRDWKGHRDGGDGQPQRVDQLAARLTAAGRRPIRPATVAAALGELHAAGLAAVNDHDQDELTGRWAALPVVGDPLLEAVDLHGAHDLRHTYATWLEDAGIRARVIDELMGHEATGRSVQQRGSAMGAPNRHTTPEMAARVVEAIHRAPSGGAGGRESA
jgi:hypothetical protein